MSEIPEMPRNVEANPERNYLFFKGLFMNLFVWILRELMKRKIYFFILQELCPLLMFNYNFKIWRSNKISSVSKYHWSKDRHNP